MYHVQTVNVKFYNNRMSVGTIEVVRLRIDIK